MKRVRGERLDRWAERRAVHERLARLPAHLRRGGVRARARCRRIAISSPRTRHGRGEFGEVLVLDWGIARVRGESDPSGVVAGTPRLHVAGTGPRRSDRGRARRCLRAQDHTGRPDVAWRPKESTHGDHGPGHGGRCARPLPERRGALRRRLTVHGRPRRRCAARRLQRSGSCASSAATASRSRSSSRIWRCG